MPARLSLAFAVSLLITLSGFAQNDNFWNKPDQTVKDDHGRVIYEEKRDAATFTIRVFSNGVWVTQHYRPHTTQLLSVDAPDMGEDWLYDSRGNYIGLRVRINGVALELHSEHDRVLSAAGFPHLTLQTDQQSRVTAIRDDKGTDVARFGFDSKGYLRTLTAGSQTLELGVPSAGKVTETLKGGDGSAIWSATVSGEVFGGHSLPFCLDVVRQQLGLGDDWPNVLKFRRSTTGSVITATGASGQTLLYVVLHGGNRFGFDAAGKPLFIDFQVPLVASSVAHGGTDTAIQIHEQSAVAPNRVVMTSDGRVGVCTDAPAAGAIVSFWSERLSSGALVTRYRTFGGSRQPKSKASAPASETVSDKRRLRSAPTNFYVCDTATVCTTDPFSGTTCNTTDYLCDDNNGATGGGTSSGGGGSGGNSSNQIKGDAILQSQVETAINTAATKLATCGGALANLYAANGQTLATWLAGKAGGPWTMGTFIQGSGSGGQTFQMDTASNPNGYCAAGYPAYTPLYQNTTFVCEQQFRGLTAAQQWVRLIHEELHCLGFPENPPASTAMTPAQISNMVAQTCP